VADRAESAAREPDRTEEFLAWVPDDAEIVAHLDFRELGANRHVRALMDARPYLVRASKITAGMLDHLYFAGKVRPGGAKESVAVLRFTADYDPNTLFDREALDILGPKGKPYYRLAGGWWMHCPSRRVMVLSDDEAVLNALVRSGGGRLRDQLRTAFDAAEGPIRGAAVGPSAQPDIRFDFAPWFRLPMRDKPHPLTLSVTASSRLTPDSLHLDTEFVYSSSEKADLAAAQRKDTLDRVVAFADRVAHPNDPDLYLAKVLHDSLTIRSRGSKVEETGQIPLEHLGRVLDLLMKER
jgi:hypothetical protein